jgi:hypothetical protein
MIVIFDNTNPYLICGDSTELKITLHDSLVQQHIDGDVMFVCGCSRVALHL